MKVQMLGLLAVLVTTQVNARSILIDTYQAELTRFEFQGDDVFSKKIETGTVTIHRAEKQISIYLVGENNCPKGAMCAAFVGPRVYEYQAKLISTKRNACGALVYKALSDLRPVDGMRTEITVTDHSSDVCEYVIRDVTEIELNVTLPRPSHTQSAYLGGKALTPHFTKVEPYAL
jgi:hypothetical protein